MKLIRRTTSLCTTCYREIPATLTINGDGVVMKKVCRVHGDQSHLFERDPVFYTLINSLERRGIYAGYFVDVTRRCNLRCEYCFYDLEKHDPAMDVPIGDLVDDCAANFHRAGFVLTGGEPTVREDIVDLVKAVSKVGPVEMLTNGVRLAEDGELYSALVPALLRPRQGIPNWVDIHLSIHPETEKWFDFVENIRLDVMKLNSILFVIDSKESFIKALEKAKTLADVAVCFRIKAASKLWNEQKPGTGADKVFVSDMLAWLDETGGYQLLNSLYNKTCFVNVLWQGLHLMLVSWHDVTNVDLLDIDCPPYYRARNGEVANLVTACLINEGMKKGYLKGVQIEE